MDRLRVGAATFIEKHQPLYRGWVDFSKGLSAKGLFPNDIFSKSEISLRGGLPRAPLSMGIFLKADSLIENVLYNDHIPH